MLEERVKILNEIGNVTADKYGGHFHNVIFASNGRLFNNGAGLIDLLLRDFPSFRDTEIYNGVELPFNKRAQLAGAMLYERFSSAGHQLFWEMDTLQFTVFADYELPKALRGLGILVYSKRLGDKIERGEPLLAGSKEEIELRAATVSAAGTIEGLLKSGMIIQTSGAILTALEIDYLLWSEGRKDKTAKPHITETTAY